MSFTMTKVLSVQVQFLYEVVKAATKAILDISSTTYSEVILKKLTREANKHTM